MADQVRQYQGRGRATPRDRDVRVAVRPVTPCNGSAQLGWVAGRAVQGPRSAADVALALGEGRTDMTPCCGLICGF